MARALSNQSERHVRASVLTGTATAAALLTLLGGLVLAVVAAVGGVSATAPVRLTAEAPAWSESVVPCVEAAPASDGSSCAPAVSQDVWPGGLALPVARTGTLVASDLEATPVTAVLAAAPLWAGLLGAGTAGLALVPSLRSVSRGEVFPRESPRQIATAAGAALLSWGVAALAPVAAASSMISALERPDVTSGGHPVPAGWLTPDVHVTGWPLLIAALLGVLAVAAHRGARLAADAEGLV
jgi:hypothetical protein